MKHTVTFNLPDDIEDLEIHLNASGLNNAVYAFDNWLRSQTKHAESSPRVDALEEVREKLYEFLNEKGVHIV